MAETEMLWRLANAAIEAGDFARAKAIYERGAALGDADCWQGLGYMFDVGQGMEADKQQAMRGYRAAWRLGRNAAAANNIAALYRDAGDRRAMFRWFKRASEQGNDGVCLELAKCYRDGVGVRRSLGDALRCLSRVMSGPCASEAEREEAQAMLASFQPQIV
jgi:uncharacterized protein